jgi:phosphatidylserine decarboxylase
MMTWLTSNLLWSEGLCICIALIVFGAGAFVLYRPLMYLVLALFIFSFYFFRNPVRVCPQAVDPAVLVCPADGKVVDVQYDHASGIEGYACKVSIFLSPLDVHVNWSPVAGVVDAVIYKPGTFSMAFLPKSSLLNERNDIRIQMANGKMVLVRQIAGTIARRICCWVGKDATVKAGQKIGMIRFGSRVDVLLPSGVDIQVGVGQRVYGGQTVLGRWL